MIPEEIKIGKVYRVFGTKLYMGQVKEFDGKTATMLMLTGRVIKVPWYEINTPVQVKREDFDKPEIVELIYAEEERYTGYSIR